MKHPTSEILYSYWNEVRQGRLAPRRFDIEPARIATILAETMILELASPATYRFRLAGTRIVEQFGMELRGMDFLTLWRETDGQRISAMLAELARSGGCGVLTFQAHSACGRTAVFEAVLLPLVHTRDEVDRYLGAMSCEQAFAWLGGTPIQSLELMNSSIVGAHDVDAEARPAGLRAELPTAGPTDPAIDPAVFHPALAAGRVVRYDRRQFRVLDGGLGQDERSDR